MDSSGMHTIVLHLQGGRVYFNFSPLLKFAHHSCVMEGVNFSYIPQFTVRLKDLRQESVSMSKPDLSLSPRGGEEGW